MQLSVRYFAGAAAAAGLTEEVVAVDDGATAADLVLLLAERRPALAPVLEVASLLVDEVAVRDRSGPLAGAEGPPSQVDVLPPFAGG